MYKSFNFRAKRGHFWSTKDEILNQSDTKIGLREVTAEKATGYVFPEYLGVTWPISNTNRRKGSNSCTKVFSVVFWAVPASCPINWAELLPMLPGNLEPYQYKMAPKPSKLPLSRPTPPRAGVSGIGFLPYVSIYLWLYIYIYIYIHTHTHIYIYIYIYI